jgi:hypothetical protein
MDANARAWYFWLMCNRWVGFRLDMLSAALLLSVTTLAAVLSHAHATAVSAVASGSDQEGLSLLAVDPGLVGLACVYAITLSGMAQVSQTQLTQGDKALKQPSNPLRLSV